MLKIMSVNQLLLLNDAVKLSLDMDGEKDLAKLPGRVLVIRER